MDSHHEHSEVPTASDSRKCWGDKQLEFNDMKNKFLILALMLFMLSCSQVDNEHSSCENFKSSFTNLPPIDLFHDYYDLLTTSYTKEDLSDCSCDMRLSIQEFRNNHLGESIVDYKPNFMPMTFGCDYLVSECEFNTGPNDEEVRDSMIASIQVALNWGIISNEEFEILSDFFNDFFIDGIVEYDNYWCRIYEAEKSSSIETHLKGFTSAFILTIFEIPHSYALSNPDYFQQGVNQRNFWKWLGGNLLWEGAKKYASCMYTSFDS